MKIFKWNVGLKGLIVGGLGLVVATLAGKVATDTLEDSIKKSEPEEAEKKDDEVLEEVPNNGDDSEESDDEIEIKEF